MISIRKPAGRLVARAATAAAVLAAGLIVSTGTAYAAAPVAPSAHLSQAGAGLHVAGYDGYDGHGRPRPQGDTSNDTKTSVHNSGSGPVAVNTAGSGGYAQQNLDQHRSDTSKHSRYDDKSHVNKHDDSNSHNSSRYNAHHPGR